MDMPPNTTLTRTETRWARWARWAAPAAGAWSLGYGALGLWWSRGGPGFPFGEGDVPDARAESLLGSATAAGTAPVIAVLGAAGALLALLLALVRPRGALRAAVLAPAWAAAFTLAALVPDGRVLLALAYAPIALIGAPWGWPDVDYFEVALPWPVLNMLVCLAGGVLWGAAALAFQRRTRGACEGCGRVEGRAARWASPASAERWGRRAAYVAFTVPLSYAAVRWAWALGVPLLISEREVEELHRSGLVWGGAALATMAVLGGILSLGLTQRWGEIWPRWVVGLAGRRVPPAFPVGFASLVTAVLASAGAMMVRITDWGDPAAWLVNPMAYWPLWAVALGVATLGYHLRRRGGCRRCGSPRETVPARETRPPAGSGDVGRDGGRMPER
ncbi:hypothetical protein HS048_26710 [Planomonospora sp. ID91781]|uniref:hypothetical protein n=1 Tax=Planomonospora sp. ID91781 TaxID=2738135 RepID=UPI0018C3762A|nr:hypothetical protein [Planomonospora sp. ID91781]MBG0824305.1 hypothetical protein [Planomonospora sp. ID91781]